MALPNPENLVYRGILSSNAQCIAYRGFICDIVIQLWKDTIRFSISINRKLFNKVEL